MKKSVVATGATFAATSIHASSMQGAGNEFYELKVYQLARGGSKNQIKEYYQQAVIPFLNVRGAKVGIFYEYSLEDPARIYILHTFKSIEDYYLTTKEMKTDSSFLEAGKDYFKLPADKPIFERFETFLMEAFDGIPQLKFPKKNRGLLELRTYESYNEDAGNRKMKMFNSEEIPLFEKVGLHPVFFGQILAGRYMPALTYMLWFKGMEERDANWEKFRQSEEWKTMRAKEEYANTVSKVRKVFLIPADYSQI